MSERKIMSLILKGFGIYVLLAALSQMLNVLMSISWEIFHLSRGWFGSNRTCLISMVSVMIYAYVAYLLLAKSDDYAGRLYPSE